MNDHQHLTPDGRLVSDLWIDRPDALEEIERRLRAGTIDSAQADNLGQIVRDGFLTVDLELDDGLIAEFESDVDRLWREPPDDLAFSLRGSLEPMSTANPATDRRAPYRITNLQSHSRAALELYLHQKVFEYLWLLFGDRPVGTSSIYFEFGSYQPLHRDPVHVYMDPPSHLLAAWIALEDVDPRSGVLTYVPGSHRLPYFQFEPGVYRFNHFAHGEREAKQMAEFEQRQFEAAGLEEVRFLPKKGEALIWHHSLLHGGSLGDTSVTRKSFVSHYSTMQFYEASRQSILMPGSTEQSQMRVFETHEVLGIGDRYGFEAPIRGEMM